MSFFGTHEFYLEVAKGNVPGHSLVHKFGAGTLSTAMGVVSSTNLYQTPIAAAALEFVSDDANDTSSGTGAREITIVGLDSNYEEVTQTLVTNGTTAVQLSTDLVRLYRWYVSISGSYADSTTGSHAGNLTIQGTGAGTIWDTISITPLPGGQSQIGVFTVPDGKTGFILSKTVFVDTTKTADIYFFQRPFANDVTPPYSGTRRLVEREVGVQGGFITAPITPRGPFVGPCDLGFLGKVSVGTAEASVEFEMILIDTV